MDYEHPGQVITLWLCIVAGLVALRLFVPVTWALWVVLAVFAAAVTVVLGRPGQ